MCRSLLQPHKGCADQSSVWTPPPGTNTSNHTWWGAKPGKCVGTSVIPMLHLHFPPTHCKATGAKNDFLHSSLSLDCCWNKSYPAAVFFHAANDNQKRTNFCWGLNRPFPHIREVFCMRPHGVKMHRVVSFSILWDIHALLFLTLLRRDKNTCFAWTLQSWHLHSPCPAETKHPLPPFTAMGQCTAP